MQASRNMVMGYFPGLDFDLPIALSSSPYLFVMRFTTLVSWPNVTKETYSSVTLCSLETAVNSTDTKTLQF